MRVPFFRVAERKEPKKGRPHCLRPLRFATGQPAVLGFGGVSLELAPFHFAQTIASPDPPNPALLGASRGAKGAGHPHGPLLRSAPSRRRKRHALRRPGRAQRWPEWMFGCSVVWMFGCPPPAGCACGGAVAGWHARRSARASCSDSPWLSERRCAAAQRVPRRTPQPTRRRFAPSHSEGVADWGSPFLW